MRKYDIIIDTDPGVDDAVANILAFFEKRLNILLFTTVSGNKDIKTCTRNLLYLEEYFNKSFPTAEGASNPLTRPPKDASFIHQATGLGNHTPSEPKKLKILKKDAVEAMYEKIKKAKNKVTILLLGPQTNMGLLLDRHPSVQNKIEQIIFMGASAYGEKGIKPHVSFNISSDPEAVHKVLQTKIPIVCLPSEIGRSAHLSEKQVYSLQNYPTTGKILFEMLNGYWEPGYVNKFVAMNDTCALFYLLHPRLFKTKSAFVDINFTDNPGKTYFNYSKYGNVKIVKKINKRRFIKTFFKHLDEIEKINKK